MKTERPTAAQIRAREGSECIYKEERLICRAMVRAITVDDWLIAAEVVPLPTPGLSAPKDPWTIGTRWEAFSGDFESWTSACSALVWRVFFHPLLIQMVTDLGQTFSGEESDLERFEKLIECINGHAIRRLR